MEAFSEYFMTLKLYPLFDIWISIVLSCVFNIHLIVVISKIDFMGIIVN